MSEKRRNFFVIVVLTAAALFILTSRQTTATPTIGLTPTVFGYIPSIFREPPTPTPTNTPVNTPTPTSTPTNTPTTAPPANVLMTYILYNPNGNDVDGEYVDIKNFGGTAANMTNWTLRDDDTHVFDFPSFTLQPNATVRVWTKAGVNNGSNLYWGSGQAIWNNTGDTAILKNAAGQTVDICSYVGGGMGASC